MKLQKSIYRRSCVPAMRRKTQSSSSEFVLSLLLLSILHMQTAVSFNLQPRLHYTPVLSREYETFCRDTQEVQCWNLPRLSLFQRYSTIATTRLYESIEQEVESQVINGDADLRSQTSLNVAVSNGAASTNGAVFTNNGMVQHDNGHVQSLNVTINGDHQAATSVSLFNMDEQDIPKPTVNGGFSHTKASRAKIGAANKGKKPWNKGKNRSEDVKARIAAGVRARNREKFMQKLKDMGVTEEEYEDQKKAERREKDAERRSRRTAKGGYRPTKETRAKISKILKEKYAKGEIKARTVDPTKVRRGFTHTEETRKKISESLKKRWATDDIYRENQTRVVNNANSKDDVRKRISESLKKKWQEPEFRAQMTEKISNRKIANRTDLSYREKISQTMKAKWQETEYREKAMKSMKKRQETLARNRPETSGPRKPRVQKGPTKGSKPPNNEARLLQPRSKTATKKKTATRTKKVRILDKDEDEEDDDGPVKVVKPVAKAKAGAKKKTKTPAKKKEKEPNGSVNRLKEERRDLFDLLYGDEQAEDEREFDEEEEEDASQSKGTLFALGDEDLDTFDPYGLDDY